MAFFDHLREMDPQQLNAFLAKRGNPAEVRAYIERMPIIVSDKKRELRVDRRFLVWWENFFLQKPQAYIIKIEDLVYCYCSPYGGGDLRIFVISSDGFERMFCIAKQQDGERAFREISRYVRGFENQPARDAEFVVNESKWTRVEINRKQIVRISEAGIFTKKITREVLAAPTNELLWVKNRTSIDADGPDDDYLVLYTLSGKVHQILCPSRRHAYGLALELKSMVPHLLYGPSTEYEQLFKTNPSRLLAIAKSKQITRSSTWKTPGNI